jgi:hypothetical protein
MKFCPTILVAAILFIAALLTVCSAVHNPIGSASLPNQNVGIPGLE